MIFDRIKNVKRYKGISKWLDIALDFLETTDLESLPLGRTEIAGDKVFVNVMEANAIDEAEAKFEIHKRYMDIQIDIIGRERLLIGLEETEEVDPYNPATDFGTVACRDSVSCTLGKDRFIICMQEEPHMPSIETGEDRYLKKCVVKVAV